MQIPLKQSLDTVSFGAGSDGCDNMDDYDQQNSTNQSNQNAKATKLIEQCNVNVSIRDIQEVRDKVPASPATPLVEPQ